MEPLTTEPLLPDRPIAITVRLGGPLVVKARRATAFPSASILTTASPSDLPVEATSPIYAPADRVINALAPSAATSHIQPALPVILPT